MKKPDQSHLKTPVTPNFCPGCGDFGIWTAFKQAAAKEAWDNSNTALVAGIGCHGHILNFIKITAFEGLHGRAMPLASGIKMANSDLNVFVFTGDGDNLAEGGNHFLHVSRRNQNITVILHDNAVYGLTTGQTSPRSPKGYVSKSTPGGNLDEPLQPLQIALSAGASFLARAYAGYIDDLAELIIEANKHDGLSVIQVLQPCVTFNQLYTHYFFQKNMYKLGADYDPTDKVAAFAKTLEWGEEQIPIGVIYRSNNPSLESQIPQIQDQSIVSRGVHKRDISQIMQECI